MTDLNVAASSAATVLSGFLASTDPGPPLALYHGVLTPAELDARPREIEALISAAAVHDLGWLRRTAVRGKDRFRWLSGMVTNMVKDLAPNVGTWNLVLNAQGRIQGDLTVWRESPQRTEPDRENDDLEMEMTAEQAEKLLAHLDHFIIMDDVELVRLELETAIGLTGPKAGDILTRLGFPVFPEPLMQGWAEWNGAVPACRALLRRGYGVLADHYAIWVPASHVGELWQALRAAGAAPVGAGALEAFRIAEGIPVYGVDMLDRDLPQETSQMRAIHFDKGCYVGQEIVERIRSRGNVHRHLRSLKLAGPVPQPETKLTLEGAEAGHITSATELPLSGGVRRFAMGMIQAGAEARNLPLHYSVGENVGTATILPRAVVER
jgi:folate-binding protein YgfZ